MLSECLLCNGKLSKEKIKLMFKEGNDNMDINNKMNKEYYGGIY